MKKYAEAIEFAAIAHDGAYRKGTTIPYITHYYDQLAIVTIYDPVMKWLEPYMSYTKRSRA